MQVRIWVAKAKSLCIYYGAENKEQGRPQTVPKSSYCLHGPGTEWVGKLPNSPLPQEKSPNADRIPYKES